MVEQEKANLQELTRLEIHRSPWVIKGLCAEGQDVAQAIIEDGALVVAGGLIKAVGKYREIVKEFSHCCIHEYEDSMLAPALINGHCHLELSHLDFAGRLPEHGSYNGDLTGWIRDLLAEREKFAQDTSGAEELIIRHARQALQDMYAAGVAFVGDVGNSLASSTIGHKQNIRVIFLLELLGLAKESEAKAFARFENIRTEASLAIDCTAHAPYSTTPALTRAMKKQAILHGQTFSIHVAESEQEVEFLQSGTGAFREFLQARGAWDGSFTIPGTGSVHYLESLGVIDAKTLCVHAVHVDHAEIDILAKRRAKICLCPGSNRFLGVGKAPVQEFLGQGILPALGTDSKASNPALSMWREMQLLREDHPGLPPASVFAMATRGGAAAWDVDSVMGSLEPGKQALVLKIRCRDLIHSARDVFEYLTTAGKSVQTEWLE